jgi:hypothetical protein
MPSWRGQGQLYLSTAVVKVRSARWVAKTYTGFPGTLVPTTTMQFPSANQHSQIPASPYDRCAAGPALVCDVPRPRFLVVPTFRDNLGPIFNYQPAPCHILEEWRCHLHGGRNMKYLRALLRLHLVDRAIGALCRWLASYSTALVWLL